MKQRTLNNVFEEGNCRLRITFSEDYVPRSVIFLIGKDKLQAADEGIEACKPLPKEEINT
jgi:hypothetical protein